MTSKKAAKSSLSREALVDRALAIVDAEGFEALTVRKVADAFGVTPMALYWHFANKEALLAAVGDAVVSQVTLPAADLPLEVYLREAMTSLIDAMRAHPSASSLMAQRLMYGENGLDLTERFLDKLALAGFDIERSAAIAHYAMQISLTLVSREPGAEVGVKPEDRVAVLEAKRSFIQGLPAERYPRLRAAADSMIECGDSDEYYADGIDIFVAGVMADAKILTQA
ncbi:TetR family transcriptional regulator [Aeromicrobium sp. NPDC092404]|uniref:TetR/AcrR family transcriptional regulator n=1 Tax=Aeromicrobium sp. NPDC092404 TaxID=3154976 RepID=UPI003425D3A7